MDFKGIYILSDLCIISMPLKSSWVTSCMTGISHGLFYEDVTNVTKSSS